MGPAFFIMAIMGCGDGDVACRQVRVADTRYVSADACLAESAAVLGRNTDLDFPTIGIQCRAATAASAQAEFARFPRG